MVIAKRCQRPYTSTYPRVPVTAFFQASPLDRLIATYLWFPPVAPNFAGLESQTGMYKATSRYRIIAIDLGFDSEVSRTEGSAARWCGQ